MRIGVDFDNTIVSYDDVFQRLAIAQALIPPTVPARKQAVRDYLRRDGREEDWIRLQGEVYGPGMAQARPFAGVLEAFRALKKAGAAIFVISHRTKHPFSGPPHDLHAAAHAWLHKTVAFGDASSPLDEDRIFFETTKEMKLSRIRSCRCTHFIDDLPEFLSLSGFPPRTVRVLFDPAGTCQIAETAATPLRSWREIQEYLLR